MSEGTSRPPAPDAAPTSVATLVSFRARSLRRRATHLGSWAGLALAALIALGLGALALAIDRGVATLLTLPDREAAVSQLRERSFWYLVGASLIFSYTTFETLFRAPDTRFVARLPVPGRTRWLDLSLRSLAVHLPLLFPGLALATSLLLRGAPALAAHAALLHMLIFTVGLSASARLHLLAGRSLLGEPTPFRHALAGGLVSDDAAFLLYSPAAGLTVSLLAAVVLDVLLAGSLGLGDSPASPALTASLVLIPLAAAALLLHRSARDADRVLPFVIPRFAELDVAPPYREDGLPAQTAGQALARHLPARARPYFLNNLHQLRRRHRLDRVLLWLFAAWLLRAVVFTRDGLSAAALALNALVPLAILTGVFLVSAFRLRGPELAAPALHATLPLDRAAARLGELAASLLHPAWAALTASAAVAVAAGPLAGLATLALAALLVSALTVAARALAALAPHHVAAMAVAWRAAVVLGAALATALSPWSSP